MKTTKLIIALLMASFIGKTQPCQNYTLNCSITVPDKPVYNSSFEFIQLCDAPQILIVSEPSLSYSWSTGSTLQSVYYGIQGIPNTIIMQQGMATVVSVTATVLQGTTTCQSSASFTLQLCGTPNYTGVSEIDGGFEAIYFDLNGNTIEPRKNELIIKQTGNVRKKVVIIDTP